MLICVQLQCLNVMYSGCFCVCGVLDDVSISAITGLTDMIISGKLILKSVPTIVMAQSEVLCLHLPEFTQLLTLYIDE